ncbi:MAG: hypothetical protein ACR2N7_06550 [Acidimicrobiia bacterium]
MKLFRQRVDSDDVADRVPEIPTGVVQVCHPNWRGVRESAYAFRDPVIEASDLSDLIPLIEDIRAAGAHTVVVQGWPPNAPLFAEAAQAEGLQVLAVFHSSPAQHGVDAGEAEAVFAMLELQQAGVLEGVATVKAGVAQSINNAGYNITHVGNRVPPTDAVEPTRVAEGTNVGIFLHPMWRKNVTTQILAAHELGWRPFVMSDPEVPYLSPNDLTVCGELSRTEFLPILAAMDITFNVTLSECHPMLPMESYSLGVPCLMSRTSDLFVDDERLYELSTVDAPDNPEAIAHAAQTLHDHRVEALQRAQSALEALDMRSTSQWIEFTRPGGSA